MTLLLVILKHIHIYTHTLICQRSMHIHKQISITCIEHLLSNLRLSLKTEPILWNEVFRTFKSAHVLFFCNDFNFKLMKSFIKEYQLKKVSYKRLLWFNISYNTISTNVVKWLCIIVKMHKIFDHKTFVSKRWGLIAIITFHCNESMYNFSINW